MKYHDITPQIILNILDTKNINKEYINTLERRFINHNIIIHSILKEIYKSKDIDLRLDILKYRLDNNLISVVDAKVYKRYITRNPYK